MSPKGLLSVSTRYIPTMNACLRAAKFCKLELCKQLNLKLPSSSDTASSTLHFQQDHKCIPGNGYKAFISLTSTKKIAFIFCSNGEFSILVKVEIKATSWRSVAKVIIYTRCFRTISTFYHRSNLRYQIAKFI